MVIVTRKLKRKNDVLEIEEKEKEKEKESEEKEDDDECSNKNARVKPCRVVPSTSIYKNLLHVQNVESMSDRTKETVDTSLFQLTYEEFLLLMNLRLKNYIGDHADKFECLIDVASIEYKLRYHYC